MVWVDRWRQGLQVNVIWYEGRSARGNEALVVVVVFVADEPVVSEVVVAEEEEEEGGRARKLGTVLVDDDCSSKMGSLDLSTWGLDAGNAGAALAALAEMERARTAAKIGPLSLLEVELG